MHRIKAVIEIMAKQKVTTVGTGSHVNAVGPMRINAYADV